MGEWEWDRVPGINEANLQHGNDTECAPTCSSGQTCEASAFWKTKFEQLQTLVSNMEREKHRLQDKYDKLSSGVAAANRHFVLLNNVTTEKEKLETANRQLNAALQERSSYIARLEADLRKCEGDLLSNLQRLDPAQQKIIELQKLLCDEQQGSRLLRAEAESSKACVVQLTALCDQKDRNLKLNQEKCYEQAKLTQEALKTLEQKLVKYLASNFKSSKKRKTANDSVSDTSDDQDSPDDNLPLKSLKRQSAVKPSQQKRRTAETSMRHTPDKDSNITNNGTMDGDGDLEAQMLADMMAADKEPDTEPRPSRRTFVAKKPNTSVVVVPHTSIAAASTNFVAPTPTDSMAITPTTSVPSASIPERRQPQVSDRLREASRQTNVAAPPAVVADRTTRRSGLNGSSADTHSLPSRRNSPSIKHSDGASTSASLVQELTSIEPNPVFKRPLPRKPVSSTHPTTAASIKNPEQKNIETVLGQVLSMLNGVLRPPLSPIPNVCDTPDPVSSTLLDDLNVDSNKTTESSSNDVPSLVSETAVTTPSETDSDDANSAEEPLSMMIHEEPVSVTNGLTTESESVHVSPIKNKLPTTLEIEGSPKSAPLLKSPAKAPVQTTRTRRISESAASPKPLTIEEADGDVFDVSADLNETPVNGDVASSTKAKTSTEIEPIAKRTRRRPSKTKTDEVQQQTTEPSTKRICTDSEHATASCCSAPLQLNKTHARAYSSLLDSMLEGAGCTVISTLDKWLKKPKCSVTTVVFCVIEAIKRHNSQPWIATQLKMLRASAVQSGSMLTANDKKLLDFLDQLFQQNQSDDEWKSLEMQLLTEACRQLAAGSVELSSAQKEAVCRWSFYLAKKISTEDSANIARSVLLNILLGEDQQHQQTALYVLLSLAVVWPNLFRSVVLESNDLLIKAICCRLLNNTSVKSKVEKLLEHAGSLNADDCSSLFRTELPSFEQMARQQLNRLSCFTGQIALDDAGLQLSTDVTDALDKLRVIGMFCDQHAFSAIISPWCQEVIDWTQMSDEDAQARGGATKMIIDILVIAQVASLLGELIGERIDGLLQSFRRLLMKNNDLFAHVIISCLLQLAPWNPGEVCTLLKQLFTDIASNKPGRIPDKYYECKRRFQILCSEYKIAL